MKICMPVKENQGLESVPFNHFGSAPFFLVFDSEKEEIKVINNGDLNHEHGKCQPIKALCGQEIDMVLVSGIGAGAIKKLNDMGIKVYKADSNVNFKENIAKLQNNQLAAFSIADSCTDHSCH
ncbi:NifB/NifX family molybdenum-iron cluster-binding protein [Hathewaya massiliensis]|uniref:NifB/NifX family molybdenum-iron cluster-binding protein n=1 Tax=Hathewaya massiliensis TaxID=1964382 RepID=UPI001157C52F|nr:NifB/NifX family molybdenum-iron cluster-binding protein [Hathewaya massiliensis]